MYAGIFLVPGCAGGEWLYAKTIDVHHLHVDMPVFQYQVTVEPWTDFDTRYKDNASMTGNVLLCPAMSFYVLIKVKKIGICLYLWSLFRIFVHTNHGLHDVSALCTT